MKPMTVAWHEDVILETKAIHTGTSVVSEMLANNGAGSFGLWGSLPSCPAPAFPLLLDRDSSAMQVWKVKGLPTTFVVGPDGRVAYRAVGGREFDHPAMIETLLALTPAR